MEREEGVREWDRGRNVDSQRESDKKKIKTTTTREKERERERGGRKRKGGTHIREMRGTTEKRNKNGRRLRTSSKAN